MKQQAGIFKVERLLDKRTKGNRVEYLVKWKNWSEAHNTWEPERNILDTILIQNYERRLNGLPVPSDSSDSASEVHETNSGNEEPISEKESEIVVDQEPVSPAMTEPCISSSSMATNEVIPFESSKREIRKTTQLVTAATQSALHQNRQRQQHLSRPSSISSPKSESCAKSLPALSPNPMHQVTEVNELDVREKIKLIIPRDRLKACPPPDVPSTDGSMVNTSQSFIDEEFPSVEKMRKSYTMTYDPFMNNLMNLEVTEIEPSASPVSNRKRKMSKCRSLKKRKRKMSNKVVLSDDEGDDESIGSCYEQNVNFAIEAEAMDYPKLAPLRIQLPKCRGALNDEAVSKWLSSYNTLRFQDLSLVRDMIITDITVNNSTITIKECPLTTFNEKTIANKRASPSLKEVKEETLSPHTFSTSDKENYHEKRPQQSSLKQEDPFVAKIRPLNENDFFSNSPKRHHNTNKLFEEEKEVRIIGKAYIQPEEIIENDSCKKVEKLVIKMNPVSKSPSATTPDSQPAKKTVTPHSNTPLDGSTTLTVKSKSTTSPSRSLPSMVPFAGAGPIIKKASFLSPMKRIPKSSTDRLFSGNKSTSKKRKATISYKPSSTKNKSMAEEMGSCSVYAFPEDASRPNSPIGNLKRSHLGRDQGLDSDSDMVTQSLRCAEFISKMNAVVNSFPFVDPSNFLGFNIPRTTDPAPVLNTSSSPVSHVVDNYDAYDELPIDLSAKR